MAGQSRNKDEYGRVRRMALTLDEPSETSEPGRGTFLRAAVVREGEERTVGLMFDFVQGEDGAWRIDRTWAWPDHGLATERVY